MFIFNTFLPRSVSSVHLFSSIVVNRKQSRDEGTLGQPSMTFLYHP